MKEHSDKTEPFAARLYVIPRLINTPQKAMIGLLRRYFERAPGWVLLTTVGRKSGLPREVLLPCERTADSIILISTYGRRSNWMRNLQSNPKVRVTCGGWTLPGHAEVLDEVPAKQALISAHPFFPALPMEPAQFLFRVLLRPLLTAFLRAWVRPRPVVVIHQIVGLE